MITEIYNYLVEQVLHNQFAQGGIIIGLMSSSFYYLRFIPLGIFNFIKRRVSYNVTIMDSNDHYYSSFNQWLYDNYSKSFRNVKVNYDVYWEDDKVKRNFNLEQYIDSFTLWYKGWPIKITKNVEKMENTYNKDDLEVGKFTLTTIFNSNILNDLLSNVLKYDEVKKAKIKKSKSYNWNNKAGWRYCKTFEDSDISNITIMSSLKSGILDCYNNWKTNKEILKQKGINLGLTYMFYGPPGSGKSLMATLLAIVNKSNIYYLNLNSINDLDTLHNAIYQIPDGSVLLIEEIEDVYDGRTNVNPDCKVPISGLLNLLSGVLVKEDLIIVMTSNNIDNLDSALIRPGRIDYFAKFTEPTNELVEEYVNKFYKKIDKIEIKTLPSSMAELENWCIANLHDYDRLINKLKNEE